MTDSSELDFTNLHLYGREDDAESLKKALLQSASCCQVVWITGHSGVGKTALVEHVLKGQSKHFCSGKFESFHSTIPYSAIASLLSRLCLILNCGYPRIELHRDESLTLAKLIPEICKVQKNDVSKNDDCGDIKRNLEYGLEPLKQGIRSFITQACRVLHTRLILFLDDLQWADAGSIEIIKGLLCNCDTGNLLFVGSYRENEVNEGNGLIQCMHDVSEARSTKCPVIELHLRPFDLTSVNHLVADLTHMPLGAIEQLSKLIYKKTDGNCFYTLHMMRNLHAKKLLYFSHFTQKWEWEAERIRLEVEFSDNVADFMSQMLEEMPSTTLSVLTLAAFMGSMIDVQLLATVYQALNRGESDPSTVTDALQVATDAHMIEMTSDQTLFKFSHEKVASAAYRRIPNGDRQKSLHLAIGRFLQSLLVVKLSPEGDDRQMQWQLILAVDQLNRGSDLIKDEVQRVELARLNLRAAELVTGLSAFKMAAMLLEIGLDTLGPRRWGTQYDLTLNMSNLLISVVFAKGALEKCMGMIEEICITQHDPRTATRPNTCMCFVSLPTTMWMQVWNLVFGP